MTSSIRKSYSLRKCRVQNIIILASVILTVFDCSTSGQKTIRVHWKQCLERPANWYSTKEAIRIGDNLLLYQFPSGGWPKNIDMAQELSQSQKNQILEENKYDVSTIDNSATYTQLRYLSRVYSSTKLDRFRKSFLKGFDYLIRSQYSNGGWPQFYPLRRGYFSHITFNDDAMYGVLRVLQDVAMRLPDFHFIDSVRREEAKRSVDLGVKCILKCQIEVGGKLTAWCAQHDEQTFVPAKARSYELPSLSGMESVGIVEFLMSIEDPTQEIIESVQSAVKWFDRAKIKGIRVVLANDLSSPGGKNKVVVGDSAAPPMWARFYQISSNKPFYCSRDGIIRDGLFQISSERRNHYAWLGYWPEILLDKEYPRWTVKNRLQNILK